MQKKNCTPQSLGFTGSKWLTSDSMSLAGGHGSFSWIQSWPQKCPGSFAF
uniref:Uncharacterized protein n=1 Tax=Anguilla anguilla TaxID=7936 RepID=A0A0E9W583_ANGAN